MKSSGRISNLWQRYLLWRSGDEAAPAKLPETPINKLAMDEGGVASAVTANIGLGDAG